MTEKWNIAIDNGQTVGAVFIDFQKAFDTVSHDILSYKLHAISISGSLHEWLMSYLSYSPNANMADHSGDPG